MILYTKCFVYFWYNVFLHNFLSDTETSTDMSLFQNTHWTYTTPTNVNWSCRFIASLEKPLYSFTFDSCGIYIFVQSDGSFIYSFGFSIEEVSTCHFRNCSQVSLWNTCFGWKSIFLGSKLSDLYASSNLPLYKKQCPQVNWSLKSKMQGQSRDILVLANPPHQFPFNTMHWDSEDQLLWALLLEEGPSSISNLTDASDAVYMSHPGGQTRRRVWQLHMDKN